MRNSLLILMAGASLVACVPKETTLVNTFMGLPVAKEQVFVIDHELTQDTVIVGESGTKVMIPYKSLLQMDGSVARGSIRLVMKECYEKEEFIANRLSCETEDGKLLQSSGMIFLDATATGNQLIINPDCPLTVYFPKVVSAGDEYLFEGVGGDMDIVKWKIAQGQNVDVERDDTVDVLESSSDRDWREGEDTVAWGLEDIAMTADTTVSFYAFEITKLNWINCDFFVNEPAYPRFVKAEKNTQIFLVFEDLNSVVTGYVMEGDDECYFSVPENRKVMLVGYHSEKSLFGFKKVNTDFLDKTALELTEEDPETIRQWCKENL